MHVLLPALLLLGDPSATVPPRGPELTLPAQRRALKTQVFGPKGPTTPPPPPPASVFQLVDYPAPLGRNAAYVAPVRPGPRRPAVLWIHGGMVWDLDPAFWEPADRADDQSAAAFRQAGLPLMIPSLPRCPRQPGPQRVLPGRSR